MEKTINGYCLTYDDTVRIAGEIAGRAYENRVVVSLDKIEGCREDGKIYGRYDAEWTCWYDNGTGLYIFSSESGGENWFADVVRKMCGDDAIVYND